MADVDPVIDNSTSGSVIDEIPEYIKKAKEIAEKALKHNEKADFDKLYDENGFTLPQYLEKPQFDKDLDTVFPANYKKWLEVFRYEDKEGWCGQATIANVLAYSGVDVSQAAITPYVFVPEWGSANQLNYSYLRRYFKPYGMRHQENSTFDVIEKNIAKGYLVIADWFDGEVGHYSIVADISADKSKLLLVDGYPGRKGLYSINTDVFMELWFDYSDLEGYDRVDRYMMWIDPNDKYVKPKF